MIKLKGNNPKDVYYNEKPVSTVYCGANLVWLKKSYGRLAGKFTDDSTESDWWFKEQQNEDNISIKSEIKEFDFEIKRDYQGITFYNNSKLELIYSFPPKMLGNKSFSGCTSLISADISGSSSKAGNFASLFSECSNLLKVNVENIDTSNVTNMRGMFYRCGSLTELDVSNFNTSKVRTMSGMFLNCYLLTSLDLSNFNTSKVSSIDTMFWGCYSLTSLDLSSFNTSSMFLNNMNGMFYYCKSLTLLNLTSFDTKNINDMSYMFCGCESLVELDLSSFEVSNNVNVNYIFTGCSKLERIKCKLSFKNKVLASKGLDDKFKNGGSVIWEIVD